jgi:hypothetical protein
MRWYGRDSPGLGSGTVEGSFEYGNELSGFMKCLEFF